MYSPDLKDSKETMYCMFVVLTNMVQLLKSKLYNKIKLLSRYVITIMQFIKIFMNGLILDLIILEELAPLGMPQSANKYS